MRAADAIMEPQMAEVVGQYIRAGGKPEEVIESLTTSYEGVLDGLGCCVMFACWALAAGRGDWLASGWLIDDEHRCACCLHRGTGAAAWSIKHSKAHAPHPHHTPPGYAQMASLVCSWIKLVDAPYAPPGTTGAAATASSSAFDAPSASAAATTTSSTSGSRELMPDEFTLLQVNTAVRRACSRECVPGLGSTNLLLLPPLPPSPSPSPHQHQPPGASQGAV